MASENNRRIAHNALTLTLRMIVVTIVGLFSSRIVLEALGVDDYGIYGVVGGVVGMASFLNTSMAGATSRFITFELGKGNTARLRDVFSTALIIHLLIAIAVVILAETVGLWFLNTKMNFPEDSMFAVNVLYQLSVASVLVGFTQVPYQADIIAHERMGIYAYLEIFTAVSKLAIAYMLLAFDSDRLILYAALIFAVNLLTAIFYRIYCIRNFGEARFKMSFDRPLAVAMIKFSGYDLYANMAGTASTQGGPIVLNLFFGVVANAASTIATTVTSIIQAFTASIAQSFRPQIIKQYASGDISGMSRLIRRSTQFNILVYALLATPVIVAAPQVLYLWLGQTPPYSVVFLQIVAIACASTCINNPILAAMQAVGNIRARSIICGTMFLLSPVIAYILFVYGCPAQTLYIVTMVINISGALVSALILYRLVREFPLRNYLFRTTLSTVAAMVATVGTAIFYTSVFEQEVSGNFLYNVGICSAVFFISAALNMPIAYFVAFNREDRDSLRVYVCEKFLSKFLHK